MTAEPYSTRRSIYGFIDRNRMANLYLAFDFANPEITMGKRYETIVPQQSLFLMNSPLVIEQARNLVERADFKSLTNDEAKVGLLYELVYQREPTPVEVQLGLSFIANSKRRDLCAFAGSCDPRRDQLAIAAQGLQRITPRLVREQIMRGQEVPPGLSTDQSR